jgi:hypothetical protein
MNLPNNNGFDLNLKRVYFPDNSLKQKQQSKPKQRQQHSPLGIGDKSILNLMENAIDGAIDNSIKKPTMLTEEAISSSGNPAIILPGKIASLRGHEYERKIISELMQAKAAGNIRKPGGSRKSAPDADINVFGKIFNVEIKLNPEAQMGGSSVHYVKETGNFSFATKFDADTQELLKKTIEKKKEELDKLLEFLSKQEPTNINERAIKFPFTCTKEAWIAARENGLLINTEVSVPIDFVANHYAKKNVYYIQIGGAGLFWLKENPANLPVPRLQGNMVVEIRSARSGTRKLIESGSSVVSLGLRAQGRLKTLRLSPYSLDNSNSIKLMLEAIRSGKSLDSSVRILPPIIEIGGSRENNNNNKTKQNNNSLFEGIKPYYGMEDKKEKEEEKVIQKEEETTFVSARSTKQVSEEFSSQLEDREKNLKYFFFSEEEKEKNQKKKEEKINLEQLQLSDFLD